MTRLLACFVGVVTADLNFLAVGDWGADNVGEYADAAGMETIGESLKPEFAVVNGPLFHHRALALIDTPRCPFL
jgi:hypothetical protein